LGIVVTVPAAVQQVCPNFITLLGTTTEECYGAVACVANQWLDILFSHAETLNDQELIDLIAENRSMSKTLAEYAGQKSTCIGTAQ